MKFFAVNGSPNRDGNSAALTRILLDAAKAKGAQVDYVNIYDYRITDVWENYFGDALYKKFEKAENDDMPLLKDKMAAADIILLASPIYWYQLSGKLKTFVDRWTDTINPDFSSDLRGKGLALVSTHTGVNAINASNILQLAMDSTAEFLGMQWLGGIDCSSKMPFTSGRNNGHEIIAADFGEKLAQGQNLLGAPVFG
ncbi:flavodoxin family protein [Cellvibrio sp. ARAG 10.3]|uniref:flavodoxin family protein n=1 Tax=Cellvibrio sp. ARAG 10.3 TaxID=3451358 RepID=UPI003F4733F6